MTNDPIVIRYQASELLAVPALHFSHVFAAEVHRICSNPATRPEAIAVELEDRSAAAARGWLQEPMASRSASKPLPVMLGLLKRNRHIRAEYKQKAFELQEKHGSDLSELSPEILKRELGFAGYSLLCLSPTDSIIEAIRCAIELNLPLYGVDLDEMASGNYTPVVIQDPLHFQEGLKAYVTYNAAYAEAQRDDVIDHRREVAMAARLKTLLQRFKRVLLTCGMAHWLPIQRLLADSSVRPAVVPEIATPTQEGYKRVVVHPLIAVHYMDRFPAIAETYETSRRPAHESGCADFDRYTLEPYKIFADCLQKAYEAHFSGSGSDRKRRRCYQNPEMLRDFEKYLINRCLLKRLVVPDLFTIIQAGQELMSKAFVGTLSQTFMRFPWALPENHPECAVLAPPAGRGNEPDCGTLVGNSTPGHPPYFYMKTVPSPSLIPDRLEIRYKWGKTDKTSQSQTHGSMQFTWAPWENLISSLSLGAINEAVNRCDKPNVEIFAGSLFDGIDVKSSIRAFSRGKETLYVREMAKHSIRYVSRTGDGFPVVWILKTNAHGGKSWSALFEPLGYLSAHVQDARRLNEVARKRGNKMVALIAYGIKDTNSQASRENSGIKTDIYDGITLYQPICWTRKQYANWLDLTGYQRNPFCRNPYLGKPASSDLSFFFDKVHGIRIKAFDWATTLMLLAIPFAKDVVTVAAPEGYRINRVVYEKAKGYGVEILTTPLCAFTRKQMEKLAICHLVPAITHEPRCVYPESVEAAIGESQTTNHDMVPRKWFELGN